MWVLAVINVLRERTSDITLWNLLPTSFRKFLLDIDLEYIRLRNSKIIRKTSN